MKAVTIILFVYDLLFYLSCSFTLYKMVNIYDIFDTHIILKLLFFFLGRGGGGGGEGKNYWCTSFFTFGWI